MQITQSTVGRKIFMSITGQLMVLFVIIHAIGNSTIFFGFLNAYAQHLHDLPPLVWAFRTVMLVSVLVHAWFGIQTTLENNAAKPQTYAVKKNLRTGIAAESMIWTGLLIAAFVIYHLLQFTVRVTPDVVKGVDAAGRFDVFSMVVNSFQHGIIAFIYVAAMAAVFLHLSHGIQSAIQTIGWNNDKTLPGMEKASKGVSFILLAGYVAVPLTIIAGILTK